MIGEIPSLDLYADRLSKRLFFGKAEARDTVWHIIDYGISQRSPDNKVTMSMALHGSWIAPVVSADTIDEIRRKSLPDESFCRGCLQAFDEAKEIIDQREGMRFEKPIILRPKDFE